MTNALADPLVILVIQALISLLGVAAAFWVANYRGEMAAAKYAQSETQRREHMRTLITNPINQLRTYLYDINNILYNRHQNIDIHKLKSPEAEFFYEHLNTGYPPLMQTICRYKESYNGIVDQVNSIYQKASDLLEQKWGDEPDFINMEPPLKSFIDQVIAYFSDEVAQRLVNNTEPKLSSIYPTDSDTIMVGSSYIIIYSPIDRKKVVSDINLILEGSEVFGEIQKLWEESKPLSEVLIQINYELNLLRSLVYAGVPLKGSCIAGREANYE